MHKTKLAFSISMLLTSVVAVQAAPDVRFELVDELTACTARLDVAHEAGYSVEGLATMRVSTKGALKFLLGEKGLDADRRRALRDITEEFSQDLQLNPMNARSKVRTLTEECRELVYEAEDVRVEFVASEKVEAERKAQFEAELRLKESEAALQATLLANRQQALELAKINADTERLKIQTSSGLESERMKIGLEETKIESATSVDRMKIQATTDQLGIQKHAEVESERTKAGVEIAKVGAAALVDIKKIDADAKVAVAGKLADMTVAHENAAVEREKIKAAANTAIASDLASTVEKVETERAKAAVDIAKVQSAAGVRAVEAIAEAHMATSANVDEDAAVRDSALECGGFYQVMMKNAPKNQRSGISALANTMFDVAMKSGADDQMVSDASRRMLMKIKASAASGKQTLQADLLSLKERCSTLSDVANL